MQYVRWTHVDLGDDDEDRHGQSQGQAQVLFGHADDAGVGPDHQHPEIGGVSGHAENGGLQILFVAGQINESDHLGALFANTNPIEIAVIRFVDNLAGGVKTKNVITNRAGKINEIALLSKP